MACLSSELQQSLEWPSAPLPSGLQLALSSQHHQYPADTPRLGQLEYRIDTLEMILKVVLQAQLGLHCGGLWPMCIFSKKLNEISDENSPDARVAGRCLQNTQTWLE